MVPPKEPLITHLSPLINRFPSCQDLFNLLLLLVLLPLIRCKILQSFSFLSDPSPEVLIFFDDSIVQLAGFAHSAAQVKFQLLGKGVSMCQGFPFSDLQRVVGWRFIDYWFVFRFAIFLVINETTIIPLIKQQLLVYFVHLLSIHCLRIFRVPSPFVPPYDLLKVQAHPRSIMRLIIIVKLFLIAIDGLIMFIIAPGKHLPHVYGFSLTRCGMDYVLAVQLVSVQSLSCFLWKKWRSLLTLSWSSQSELMKDSQTRDSMVSLVLLGILRQTYCWCQRWLSLTMSKQRLLRLQALFMMKWRQTWLTADSDINQQNYYKEGKGGFDDGSFKGWDLVMFPLEVENGVALGMRKLGKQRRGELVRENSFQGSVVCSKGKAKLLCLIEVEQLRQERSRQPQRKLQPLSFQHRVNGRRNSVSKIIPFSPKLSNIPIFPLELILILLQ